jgi:DNA-binding NarL/FixJ family response regulator
VKKARILLADDHPYLVEKVTQLLQPEYEVLGAVSDGQALVSAVEKLKPDVLVVDVTMPILDGIEAAKRLKAQGCESKIVFLTVHSDPDYLRACLAAGGLGYVAKSRMSSDLPRAVDHALAERIFISPTMTGQQ